MGKHVKFVLTAASLIVLVSFVILVINQTVQVVGLAANFHPLLGKAAAWGLAAMYIGLLLIPLFMILRLPRALQPPGSADSPEYARFLRKLAARLKKNRKLRNLALSTPSEIEEAVQSLNGEADTLIKNSAAAVFVTTAISQSGRLDAVTVLIAQVRMVWQVAHVYNQRPTLRDMIHLYANVAGTAFVAGELNDIDISEQIEPVITSVLGTSLTGSIPGIANIAGIVTNSLLTGSANAFLTLRIGIIAKQYSGALIKKESSAIRRSAGLEGARMLSLIVMNSAGRISKSIMNAAVKKPGQFSRDMLKSTWGKISGKKKSDREPCE